MDTIKNAMCRSSRTATYHEPRTTDHGPRTAFTLVELLVVITIIGILASLIVVAAVGALKKGQETRIKAELNQIADAIEDTKTKNGSYPPNCQTDDTNAAPGAEPAATPISEATVLADLRTYLQQVAPRHKESENLLRVLCGLTATGNDASNYQRVLPGGMTSGEAIVFWLGGFSSDPKYPISGEGGPSYNIGGVSQPDRRKADPISSRSWAYDFEVARLGPRADDDEYFDDQGGRYIEYTVNINGQNQQRRINFWQFRPAKSVESYMYFDTSRHPAGVVSGSDLLAPFDPPAATALTGLGPGGEGLHVHALKRRADTVRQNVPLIEFVNPEKFQVLHCGIDDAWGEEAFEKMSAHEMVKNDPDEYLLFPNGPFSGDVADTIVNFATQTRLEDTTP